MEFLFVVAAVAAVAAGAPTEPYPWLENVNSTGAVARPSSPDPLVRATWDPHGEMDPNTLQVYARDRALAFKAEPPSSFIGAESCLSGAAATNITVRSSGSLRLDFGVEHAAWFEFQSDDLTDDDLSKVRASISEYDAPWPGKTQPVKPLGSGWYRLDTNSQLYEGVRFAWLIIGSSELFIPWTITTIRIVAQTRPVNYTGSFSSSNELLESVWYSGAYGVRLNLLQHSINSIVMDRGDRVSIQGDGHPTMATGIVLRVQNLTITCVVVVTIVVAYIRTRARTRAHTRARTLSNWVFTLQRSLPLAAHPSLTWSGRISTERTAAVQAATSSTKASCHTLSTGRAP